MASNRRAATPGGKALCAVLPAVLVLVVTLITAVGPAAAASSIGVPPTTVPSVTVPSLAVPPVTVPSATVPPAHVGPVSTPPVSTPRVSTPPVGTPRISTPPVGTPALPAPSVGPPRGAPAAGSGAPARVPVRAPGRGAPAGRGVPGRAPARRRAGAGASGSRGAPGSRSVPAGARPLALGAVTPGVAALVHAPAAAASPTAGHRLPVPVGALGRLIQDLPTAVLIALLAFAVIAAAMALNAYLQTRRAHSLAHQRASLLSDVGVLQAALLPAVPENLGELDVSVAYRPAQGLAAGGDFFDVFALSPETTGIIIGDVSGHGRESLIHAALVRYTLRTLMGEGHVLSEVLARADRYLTGELGDGFATVVVCAYEHATGELTWAKAGHEPPIVGGEPDHEEEAAFPLGLGLGESWPHFSRSLACGERICLFTDGLTEARRRGEQLGRAHLKTLVEQGLSAQDLVERVEADADDCTDDLAAVVLRRRAAGTVAGAPAGAREASSD